MADILKILGQVAPADTSNADLYTVPEGTQTTVSSLVVCNLTTSTPTFRVAVRPFGATVANEMYIYYDKVTVASDSRFIIIGITLSDTDIVTVRSSAANQLAFTLFGVETS